MNRFILTAALLLTSAAAATAQVPSQPGTQPTAAPQTVTLEQFLAAPEVQQSFPRLGANIRAIAPASERYNAYSYVMGITDQWLAPRPGTAESQLRDMDELLSFAGYRRLKTLDLAVRPGKQKAVVYGTLTLDGQLESIKSAALQHADGNWSCKFGKWQVLQFAQPDQLSGPGYGVPVLVYERDLPVPVSIGR